MSLRLAVAFDGTLVELDAPLRWRPGAREALASIYSAGHRLILTSPRCVPLEETLDGDLEAAEFYRWGTPPASAQGQWDAFSEMRDWLQAEGAWGLFVEVWQGRGSPQADLHVDATAERPDWIALTRQLGSEA